MAAPSASEELEALEMARARLEAALSSDENWRALRQSRAEGAAAGDDPARRARDTRLEMALAGNALYQAWKHTNGAIDALHARRAAQALATAPLEPANPHAVLPDDVAALLQDEKPKAHTDKPAARENRAPRPGGRRPISRLADRLGRLEAMPEAEAAQPVADENRGVPGRPHRPTPKVDPEFTEPPEATVTFVVREAPASLSSREQSSDIHSAGNPDAFERLRSTERPPERAGRFSSASEAGVEEAEVTIMTAEQLEETRASEQRAGIVSRFRKALSGD